MNSTRRKHTSILDITMLRKSEDWIKHTFGWGSLDSSSITSFLECSQMISYSFGIWHNLYSYSHTSFSTIERKECIGSLQIFVILVQLYAIYSWCCSEIQLHFTMQPLPLQMVLWPQGSSLIRIHLFYTQSLYYATCLFIYSLQRICGLHIGLQRIIQASLNLIYLRISLLLLTTSGPIWKVHGLYISFGLVFIT